MSLPVCATCGATDWMYNPAVRQMECIKCDVKSRMVPPPIITGKCNLCNSDAVADLGAGSFRGQAVLTFPVCANCYITYSQKPGGKHGVSRQAGSGVYGSSAGTGGGGGAAVTSSISPGSVTWVGTRAQNAAAIAAKRYGAGAAILSGVSVGGQATRAPEQRRGRSPHEGIRVGEITAYRCWQYRDGLLRSVSADEVWAPGEAMTCEVKQLDTADVGIHCYKLKRQAYKYPAASDKSVFGSIAIWGEIREHELGYRAEYAKVTGLDRPQWMQAGEYHQLLERYGLSVAGAVPEPPHAAKVEIAAAAAAKHPVAQLADSMFNGLCNLVSWGIALMLAMLIYKWLT